MPRREIPGQSARDTPARDVRPIDVLAALVERDAHRDLELRPAPLRARAVAALGVRIRVTLVVAVHPSGVKQVLRATRPAEPRRFLILVVDLDGKHPAAAVAGRIPDDLDG